MNGPDLILPGAPHVDYVESGVDQRGAVTAITQNAVYLMRVTRFTLLHVAKFYVRIGTADAGAGKIDIGAYHYDGSLYALLGHTGEQGQTASSVNEFDPAAVTDLPVSGDVYLSIGTNSATVTVMGYTHDDILISHARKLSIKTGAYSSGLPATISSPAVANFVPWVGARS